MIIMFKKNITLTSPDNSINLSVFIFCEGEYTNTEIKGNINTVLSNEEVLKAYLTNSDSSKINLGVMDISFGSVSLTKKVLLAGSTPQKICITKKNTSTQEEKIIAKGSFIETNLCEDNYSPLNKAQDILDKIKNASETNDQGISKRNCINIIKRNLSSMKSFNHTYRIFDRIYISETFSPVSDLSSLKFVMSGGLCACSFFETGHYYLSFRDNYLLIAFREYNGQNPLCHIGDFSSPIRIDSHIYHGVMIELADEGQYFVI